MVVNKVKTLSEQAIAAYKEEAQLANRRLIEWAQTCVQKRLGNQSATYIVKKDSQGIHVEVKKDGLTFRYALSNVITQKSGEELRLARKSFLGLFGTSLSRDVRDKAVLGNLLLNWRADVTI